MPSRLSKQWGKTDILNSRQYTCGVCHGSVISDKGWQNQDGRAFIYVCHSCNWPTVFDGQAQYPAPRSGEQLKRLPPDVENLWDQILDAQAAGAPALAVMGCRKMLIHVAEHASLQDVASGDVEGEPQQFGRFTAAEKYLEENHWLPKGALKLGEKIRKKGDEVNHLGSLPATDEAQETIAFMELVLRYVYQVPAGQAGLIDEEALRDKVAALKQKADEVLAEEGDA